MTTIRQSIMSDDAISRMIDEMIGLPERIKDANDALATTEFNVACFNKIDAAKERVAAIEAEANYIVLNEINGDGKKKYSNEAQRASAVLQALQTDQSYIDARNELLAAKQEKFALDMQMAKERNNLKYLVDLSFTNKAVCEMIAGLCREDHTSGKLELIARKEAILSGVSRQLEGVKNGNF